MTAAAVIQSNSSNNNTDVNNEFTSPYVFSTFEPQFYRSVRDVYKERIESIYRSKYPILAEIPLNIEHELLQRRLKEYTKAMIAAEKALLYNEDNGDDEKNPPKDADADAVPAKNANNANDANVANVAIDAIDVIDANNANNNNDNNIDGNINLENEILQQMQQSLSYEDSLRAAMNASLGITEDSASVAQQHSSPQRSSGLLPSQSKLLRALELLENEYFGIEHQLYAIVCAKYDIPENQRLSEYVITTYVPPLQSEKLLLENFTNVECYECKQKYDISLYSKKEVHSSGHFIACIQCEPDRTTIKNLKFSKTFISKGVQLQYNENIAIMTDQKHHCLLIDMKPMKSGLHCFRWKTEKFQNWCLWGISYAQKYVDNSFQSPGVYAMAPNTTYVNGQQKNVAKAAVFYQPQMLKAGAIIIDMLVDFKNGELRYRSPFTGHECVIPHLPKYDGTGFVPHCNVYHTGAVVQIKKIPVAWFGKNPNRISFREMM